MNNKEELELYLEERKKKNTFIIIISLLVAIMSLIFLIFQLGQIEKEEAKKKIINPNINQMGYSGTIFIGFTSSTCPHCIDAMPKIDKIQAKYPEMKMVINVLNGKAFKGIDYVAQITDKDKIKNYEDFTGERCDYVPSYLIKKGKQIIDKKCGGVIGEDELLKKMGIKKKENKLTDIVDKN